MLCAAAAGRFAHNPTCHVAPRTLPGFALFAHDPRECAHVSADVLSDGVWEPYKSARFAKLLGARAPGLVVDVGANIGWYALLAAHLGHGVVAFEPAAYNAELLRASAWANGVEARVDLRRVALADAPADGPPSDSAQRNSQQIFRLGARPCCVLRYFSSGFKSERMWWISSFSLIQA